MQCSETQCHYWGWWQISQLELPKMTSFKPSEVWRQYDYAKVYLRCKVSSVWALATDLSPDTKPVPNHRIPMTSTPPPTPRVTVPVPVCKLSPRYEELWQESNLCLRSRVSSIRAPTHWPMTQNPDEVATTLITTDCYFSWGMKS